jgi:hydrophobe/amphiphile efflux-1 (HAE1) family protein
MLKRFIERPVLSTVISIILLLLGGLSLFTLPVTLFPDIAPPSVQVTAVYPGANAEVVARTVATPIEEAVNGVENMTYMTSNSSNDGSMGLTVFFKQGTNPDIAAVNVQNRVSTANSQLPPEVVQAGVSTQKVQNSFLMFEGLYSDDSAKYDEVFLENYLRINVIPQLQRIHGVAQALVFSSKNYSMRIWLKPDRLAANDLSPEDVINAIKDQNIEAAPGRLGQSSSESFEYIIKYKGKLNRNQDYENMVVKANSDGSVLRLKDVARVEFGAYTYSSSNKLNGHPAAGFGILQTPGSNANEIITELERQLDKFSAGLPAGMKFKTMYNSKEFLDASTRQVKETLLIAFILVALVVFIFLQDLRSTLIPAIAVPVAIVGTFFFLQLFGFTINLLTLFALVLAIGIVVDDAIVVVEAVHTKMERTGFPARKATIETMSEISGVIISITLVMAAVFIPVSFMQGPAGVFYRQFAITLATAIGISAINALTLSPALCALFLKNPHAEEGGKKKSFRARFFTGFNAAFKATTQRYVGSVRFLTRHKWVGVLGLLLISITAFVLVKKTPTGFIPEEDQGFIIAVTQTPGGSSLSRTVNATDQISKTVLQDGAASDVWNVNGLNFVSFAFASPNAAVFSRLKPLDKRGPVTKPNQIAGRLMGKTSQVHDALTIFVNFPTVQGFGNVSGVEVTLQDRASGPLDKLAGTAWGFVGALSQRKEVAAAFTTFNTSNPQYTIEVDYEKAKQLGVGVSELLNTLQIYYGSTFVSDFNRFGKYYRVMAQADAPYRTDVNSLTGIYVKNNLGSMVPVTSIAKFKRTYGPETVTRNNLYNAVVINATPKPGYSTGDVIKAVQETANSLPGGFAYEWTGITREEIAAGSQQTLIFVLSLVFVFFLLAAQYESYILPFAVILTIPTGILGVFLFVGFAGLDNNIYVQIGLIMLIGLLSKNAILIVQYAVQRRRQGMTLIDSVLEATSLRFRPILMTSLAFIVGMMPLIFVQGASANGNHSIGWSVVGGMLTGVLLGVFIIPVLFVIFQYLQEKVSRKKIGDPGTTPEHLAE